MWTMAAAAPGRPSMLALALCLAAAAAAPPAAADHEAELMRIIQELRADAQVMHADFQALQRNVTKMSQRQFADEGGESAAEMPRRHSADEGGEGAALALAENATKKLDLVNVAFNMIQAAADNNLQPLLLNHSSVAFRLSLLMVLQWHVRFHFAEYLHQSVFKGCGMLQRQTKPFMTLRRLGVNILIFNIYFNTDLPLWHSLASYIRFAPFCCSAILVFADTVGLYYAIKLASRCCGFRRFHSWSREARVYIDPLDDEADDGRCPQKSEASNIFEDLTFKFRKAVPIFFVQLMLAGFYIEFLNSDHKTKKLTDVNMVYWVVAVVFTIEGGERQLGEAFNAVYWHRILTTRISSCFAGVKGVAQKEPFVQTTLDEREKMYQESFKSVHAEPHRIFMWLKMPCIAEWHLRCAMDWLMNSVARSLILYTVPIVVCVEKPLDFVKDLTAVMFMTTLDDIDNGRDVQEILVKLKYELYRSYFERSTLETMKKWLGYEEAPVPRSTEIKISLTVMEKKYVDDNPDEFELLTDLDKEHFDAFCKRSPHQQENV